jgi:hypothetical protein
MNEWQYQCLCMCVGTNRESRGVIHPTEGIAYVPQASSSAMVPHIDAGTRRVQSPNFNDK